MAGIIQILANAGRLLPDRAWRLVWKLMLQNDRMMDRQGWRCLGEIAERLHIDHVGVDGDYGTINSSPRDAVILKEYAERRRWADSTNAIIREFFGRGGGTYFDIGANIGMTIIPIASTTRVACHAFEPEPTNFKNLCANVRMNCQGADITLHQLALFDRRSTLSFELSGSNLGDHRVRASDCNEIDLLNESERRTINVPCERLDDLRIPIDDPLFVKMDTQGAEPFIISGGRQTLARADVLLTEWSPYLMRRTNGDPRVLIDFLRSHFTHGAVNKDDIPGSYLPIADLCDLLSNSLTTFSGIEYIDIVVRK